MSNIGQAALSIAGFAIGSYIGYPQLGFIVGSLAGNAIFPTKLPGQSGPRLTDARTTTAQMGGPVMEVFGTDTVPGNVMWMAALREVSTTEEVGGKGGPSQEVETFTYYQSIAVGLCRGPKVSVLRIWENGKLVYDIRPQLTTETDDEFAARVTVATAYAETFTLYLGTEDQLPDPTIELDKGVGDTPAFRGLCYIVYNNRQLKDEQALRHPNFKFEVSDSDGVSSPTIEYSTHGTYTWNKPANLVSAVVDVIAGGGSGQTGELTGGGEPAAGGQGGYGGGYSSATFLAADLPDTVTVTVGRGGLSTPDQQAAASVAYTLGNTGEDSSFGALLAATGGGGGGTGDGPGTGTTENGGTAGGGGNNPGVGGGDGGNPAQAPGGGGGGGGINFSDDSYQNGGDGGASGAGSPAPVPGGLGGAGVQGLGQNGFLGGDADHDIDQLGGGGGGGGGSSAGDGPGGIGIGAPGATGGNPGAGGGGGGAGRWRTGYTGGLGGGGAGADGWVRVRQTFGSTEECTSLGSVVQAICVLAGLTTADIDTTDIDAICIKGYSITRVMSAVDALEPLRLIGFFDVIESDGILKFRARGGAIGYSIPTEALGAFEGEGGAAPPRVKIREVMGKDLPRIVRLHYKAPSRDYEDGEQDSPSRSTSEAVQVLDLEAAVSIDDDTAAQAAEVLWADAWEGRVTFEIQLDSYYADIEPGDVVELPVEGFTQRARITEMDESVPQLRRLMLVRDYDGSYVSQAVADAPERTPGAITVLSVSEILFLDTPAIREEDDEPGIYVTTRPATVGATWRAAEIHQSTDGGVTFSSVLVVGSEPATGEVVTPLPVGDPATWDSSATLRIQLRTGTLSSRSAAAVLAGANMAAVGIDGRWELLQFQTVTQVSADTFDLTVMARGRRGTEHIMGSGEVGDTFVLLSGNGIMRIPMVAADMGVDRIYRAVTNGTAFAVATDQTFATRGIALRPFSPIDVEAEVDLAGDTLITWKRRDRMSQTLQGGALPLSDIPEAYEIDVYNAGSPTQLLRTLDAAEEQVTYTVEDRVTDFGSATTSAVLEVHQVNPDFGRGPGGLGTVTFPASDLVFPESRATFQISGFFNVADGFNYLLTYSPRAGSPVTVDGQITGSGKTTLAEFASALAAALDAALPAAVVVTNTGGGSPELREVVVSTYDGTLSASVTPLVAVAVVFRLQEPLPVTAGQNQVVEVDLWDSVTPSPGVKAPETTTAYRTGGSASFTWTVGGLTYEIAEALVGGAFQLQQNGFWSVGNNISSGRTYALQGFIDEMTSGNPNLRDYVQTTEYSQNYGADRAVALMIAKDGYQVYAAIGSNDIIGSHPSTKLPRLRQLQAGIKSWPSGAKAKDRVYFSALYTGDPTPEAVPYTGQALQIYVDGTLIQHVLTAPEAAAFDAGGNTADYATVYQDFRDQINALGGYSAATTAVGSIAVADVRIERTAANTAMTVTARAQYDLAIGVTIT